ncbi:hypothetical protein MBAV_003610 [Candidatus Magnetobacterium bavaricum]|uniref:Uncharacterized protein n=1 Tax=Candidatus Magnetobacterium bavaricum TaxID=29290 RepID=A0A0F3GQK9_9BACT|nr:hypothetical protein MBAV_003610 [Candidatus Magnetobacterium bavaricum]
MLQGRLVVKACLFNGDGRFFGEGHGKVYLILREHPVLVRQQSQDAYDLVIEHQGDNEDALESFFCGLLVVNDTRVVCGVVDGHRFTVEGRLYAILKGHAAPVEVVLAQTGGGHQL